MGFLDAKDRIVDFVLTERGRQLYALGELDFTYFAVFDDGIDYDPWSQSDLSDSDRESLIESTAMFEAPSVPLPSGPTASLEPRSHVFTAADGYNSIPRPSIGMTASLVLSCDQYSGQSSAYYRVGTNHASVQLGLQGDTEPHSPGFDVTVYASGSSGLQELSPRIDSSARRCFDPFVACTVDTEEQRDLPSTADRRSVRR